MAINSTKDLRVILGERITKHANGMMTEQEAKDARADSEVIAKLAKQYINSLDIDIRAKKLDKELEKND